MDVDSENLLERLKVVVVSMQSIAGYGSGSKRAHAVEEVGQCHETIPPTCTSFRPLEFHGPTSLNTMFCQVAVVETVDDVEDTSLFVSDVSSLIK